MTQSVSQPAFGRAIRKARRALDLTQKEASKRTDVPLRTLGAYERGEIAPQQDRAAEIGRALGIEPAAWRTQDLQPHGGIQPWSAEDGQRERAAAGEPRAPCIAAPEGAVLTHVLDYGQGPAVGWDINTARWVQVGPPGHVRVTPSSAPVPVAPGTSAAAS